MLKVFDVFGMIPPPSDRDGQEVHDRFKVIKTGKSNGIGGDTYYGYETGLIEKVKANLRSFGLDESSQIYLVQGLYNDSLQIEEVVGFVHIDCDWYDSVMVCLERITPYLSIGGVMIIDDYYDWSGCRTAVDDYFTKFQNNAKFTFTKRYQKLNIKRIA